MMKKIILFLACAAILTSSFAMNTPIQTKPVEPTQSNTTTQQTQTKSALGQLIKANPALSAVLPLYIAFIVAGNGLFVWDALTHGDVPEDATTEEQFEKRLDNFFTTSLDDEENPKIFNCLSKQKDDDGYFKYSVPTIAYNDLCPGFSTLRLIIENESATQKNYSTDTIIAIQLLFALGIIIAASIIALGVDLSIALTLYENNIELQNKNLLIAIFNKIFRKKKKS